MTSEIECTVCKNKKAVFLYKTTAKNYVAYRCLSCGALFFVNGSRIVKDDEREGDEE
jgi:ribosomal protein S27E